MTLRSRLTLFSRALNLTVKSLTRVRAVLSCSEIAANSASYPSTTGAAGVSTTGVSTNISNVNVEKVNNYLRSKEDPDYVDEILSFADEKEDVENSSNNSEKDELYKEAVELIKSEQKASTSFLQRKLQIGYNRAARIIDMMEAEGIVSKANHVGKRDVL